MVYAWMLRWTIVAALLAGCAPAAVTGLEAPVLVSYPVRVEQAVSGAQAALTLSVEAMPAAGYRTQYVNVLDWELADATLSNADASIPSLSRTAAVSVDASLVRTATLEFAPIKPAGGYTLTIALKRRDRAGVYQTVATGTKSSFALTAGANNATVTFSPTSNGQLQVSAPQPALPFVRPPVVESLFPATGSIGMLIDVLGVNFGATPGANSVAFNGTAATVVTATTTRLSAEVPAAATSGALTVVANGKSGTSPSGFSVVPSGTPLGTYGAGASPWGMAIDASGNVWVANSGGTTVSKLSPTGALLATYPAGTNPTGVAFDGAGNLWVTNATSAGKVLRLAPDGSLLGTTNTGMTPREIMFDGLGNAWVASTVDHALIKLNAAGAEIGYYFFGTGASTAGGLVVTPGNTVWVCDVARSQIVHRANDGTGIATVATAGTPVDIALDGAGNLWVAIAGADELQKFTSAGVSVGSYNLGPADPRSVAVDPLGQVWVTSASPAAVIKVSPTGTVLGTYTLPDGGVPRDIIFDRHRAPWVSQSVTNAVTKLAL